MSIENRLKKRTEKLRLIVIDDGRRKAFMFRWLNLLLAAVSLMMSIINVFTREYVLMGATLAYACLCLINYRLSGKRALSQRIGHISFATEALALMAFFLISGIPDGFSILWICLIPSFALLIFGRRGGSLFCALALLMMVFLFWMPWGRGILQYQYSSTFMLRFPFLYVSIFAISLFIEYVRGETQKQLVEAEEKFCFLYRHDALTGLYNRYGFDEAISADGASREGDPMWMIMIDIDNFKQINDRYGHTIGDRVLKRVADILSGALCEDCVCCRWGGEEFLVMMRGRHDVMEQAEKLRASVEKSPMGVEPLSLRVTVSVGVCAVNGTGQAALEAAVAEADRCMYEAKRQGKNRVVFQNPCP